MLLGPILESAVDDRVVIFGLLLGCLTNLACLYSYL